MTVNWLKDTAVKIDPWMAICDSAIDKLTDEQIEIRRHLHAHPEPSGNEFETTRFIDERLHAAGISTRLGVNPEGMPVGLIADVLIGSDRSVATDDRHRDTIPIIAIRADIDALRMPDRKAVPYASRHTDLCHACGHDAHTSIALTAALVAQQCRDDHTTAGWSHPVQLRFLFQPAEEIASGAHWLVEKGAMDGVTAILGVHVDPERKAGSVGIRYGALTANCDEVEITIEGHGGHAARPHHSLDPVATAAQLVGALHTFLPRSVDARHPSVFTIGKIAGGYAPNVIPERVQLWGSLRSTQLQHQDRLKEQIVSISHGIAQATGTRIDVRFDQPLKGVYNHPRVAAAIDFASNQILPAEHVQIIDLPSMGGEDFSVYLDHAPGAMLRLGCATPVEHPPFLHSPYFDIDERSLNIGSRILLRAALLLAHGFK